MTRFLGKRPAVHDARHASLASIAAMAALPSPPPQVNWRADLPPEGVAMLGNDRAGCCVWASFRHYLRLLARYTGSDEPWISTTAECLADYATTGWVEGDPLTDNGTVVMGRGGAVERWVRDGLRCGDAVNRLEAAVLVDHAKPEMLKLALSLGPVLCGAMLVQSDVDSDFMWDARTGAVVGGHEFLLLGYETISTGKTYYDVETWDSLWRCTDTWVAAAVDETLVPFNAAFFDAKGVDPAGLDMTAVRAAVGRIRA